MFPVNSITANKSIRDLRNKRAESVREHTNQRDGDNPAAKAIGVEESRVGFATFIRGESGLSNVHSIRDRTSD